MTSKPSLKELENQLLEARQRNANLTAELSRKKQTLEEIQSNNRLFQLYNSLKKGNVDYQMLMNLEDIPIPGDLEEAIQERNEFDSQYSETDKKLKLIVNFIAGQDKSEEILNNESKSIELLDDYIKISNQILNGL